MALPVSDLYIGIINSFKSDCDQLLNAFKEKNSSDFPVFVDVWKILKFSLIYEKYRKYGYLQEFKEDTLHLAKKCMIDRHFVGGLYLIYGLYFIQSPPKVCIRLELEELNKIIFEIQKIGTLMPGYIFSKLLVNNAFVHVAFSREFTMEGMNRARLIYGENNYVSSVKPLKDQKRVQAEDVLNRVFNKYNIDCEEIKEIDEKYEKKIKILKEEFPEVNLSLGMAPKNTRQFFEDYLSEAGVVKPKESSTTSSIGHRRKKLKGRKMKAKLKYAKKEETSEDSTMDSTKKPAKRGAPIGERKCFVLKAINSPSDSENEYFHSDCEDVKPSLLPIL